MKKHLDVVKETRDTHLLNMADANVAPEEHDADTSKMAQDAYDIEKMPPAYCRQNASGLTSRGAVRAWSTYTARSTQSRLWTWTWTTAPSTPGAQQTCNSHGA
jgi:hypothetical protein